MDIFSHWEDIMNVRSMEIATDLLWNGMVTNKGTLETSHWFLHDTLC